MIRLRLSRVILVSLLTAAGCGSALRWHPASTAAPATAPQQRERDALGSAYSTEGDPVEEDRRLRALAAFSLRTGNRAEFWAALWARLELAIRQRAGAVGPDEAVAERRLAHIRADVMTAALGAGEDDLALQSYASALDPEPFRALAARIGRGRGRLQEELPDGHVDGTSARLRASRAVGRDGPHDLAMLRALGRTGLPLVLRELNAADSDDDVERRAALAELVLEHDPFCVGARLITELAREPATHRAALAMPVRPWTSGQHVARLALSHAERPNDPAVELGFAWLLTLRNLGPDARALLESRDRAESHFEGEREAWEAIAALVGADRNQGDALLEFVNAHDDARRSPSFATLLLSRTNRRPHPNAVVEGPEPHPALFEASGRMVRSVLEHWGRDSPLSVARWALAHPGDASARRRAQDTLAYRDPALAAVAGACIEDSLDQDACDARLRAAEALGEDEFPAGEGAESASDVLGDDPPLEDGALYGLLAAPDDQLEETRAWLDRLGRTRLSLGAAWVTVRARLALRAGDLETAREMLDAPSMRRLPATERLPLRLWLLDLEAGIPVERWVPYTLQGLGEAPRGRRPQAPRTGALGAVQDAWSRLGVAAEQAPVPDAERIGGVMDALPNDEQAVVHGLLGRLAAEREDDDALRVHAAAAREAAPGSADALALSGLVHERAERADEAMADYAGAWRARWNAHWAAAALRRVRGQQEATRPAREALGWLHAFAHQERPVLEAIAVEAGDTASLLETHARVLSEPHLLPPSLLARLPNLIRRRAYFRGQSHVAAASNAAEARARASELLPHLEALPDDLGNLSGALWVRFLAGSSDVPTERPDDLAIDAMVLDALPARGQLTDELAYRVYTQLNDDEVAGQLADDLVAALPPSRRTDPLLCTALSFAGRADAAVPPCLRAHRAGHDGAAYRLAWALGECAAEVQVAAGLDESGLLASIADRIEGDDGYLAGRIAALAVEEGNLEAAWRPRLVELAHSTDGGHITVDDLDGARFRAASVRAQTTEGGWARASSLAEVALAAGDLSLANEYVTQAEIRGAQFAPADRQRFLLVRDLVAWATADLEAGHLTADGLRAFEVMRNRDLDSVRLAQLSRLHPESRLVRFANAVHTATHGQPQASFALFSQLLEEAPRPSVLAINAPLWVLMVGEEQLAEHRQALFSQFPDDERLAPVAEEAPVTLPRALATAEAFEAGLHDAEARLHLENADLQRVGSEAVGAEFAVPSGAQALSPRFGFQWQDAQTGVVAEPRHSDCDPETCVDQIVPQFTRLGFVQRHVVPATLAVGEGRRVLLTLEGQALMITIVPVGLRVYVLATNFALDIAGSGLDLHRLTELTFRPTDVVVGPVRAERLRGEEADAVPWALRRRARVAVESAQGGDCPLDDMLDALAPPERAGVLRAIYLSTPQVDVRRRVAACADLAEPGHGALGLAAALDPDVQLHDFGHRAVASDAEVAGALVEALAPLAPELPQSGTARQDTDLPRFGFVEMLAALPVAQRRAVTDRLSRSEDTRVRALALASDFVAGGTLSRARLREIMLSGTPSDTLAVLDSFYGPLSSDDAAAMRARLDSIARFERPLERRLASRLSFLLARRLERQDLSRFERLMAETEGTEDDRERLWGRASWDRELVRHALGIEASDDENIRARAEARRLGHAQRTGPRRVSPQVAERLRDAPLPEVLPGPHWQYVRVPQPALFLASLEQIYARLQSSNAADTALARQGLERLFSHNGGDLLASDGGLDLSRPVECARSDRFPPAWVCAAYVADRDAVRTTLARRRSGSNSGVALAMDLSRFSAMLPSIAGALPITVSSMIDPPTPSGPARNPIPGATLDRQRVRGVVDLGGVEVERFGVFSVREGDQPSSDTEHYLFTGDRILMFGLESTARAVLRTPRTRGQTLAGSPTFRRLTSAWTDGAALQMASVDVGLGEGVPLPDEEIALELVADSQGLTVRVRTPLEDGDLSDVSDLSSRLPEGAVSEVSLSLPAETRSSFSNASETNDPRQPPLGLLAHASGFAFGWYAAPGEGLWDHWVAVLRRESTMADALAEEEIELTDGAPPSAHGDLFYARRGPLVSIGTHPQEVAGTLVAAPRTRGSGQVGSGRLDGVRGAGFLLALAASLPPEDPRRRSVAGIATMVGIGRELSFDAERSADGRTLHLVTRALPNLAEEESARRIIDHALANPRNALALPRGIRDAERRGALTLVFETSDAQAAQARLFQGRRRTASRVLADNRLEVTVQADAEPSSLSDRARDRMTARDDELSLDDAAILAAARELGPAGTPVATMAARASRWVHRHVRYELTSDSLTAATILSRGRGDCTEYARLTVALLRSRGVPAALREGFAVAGGEMVAHAWVTYYDGERYRELDPTAGTSDVGADHIPMSVADTIAFLSIGDLRVTEVRAEPAAAVQ
ncbi:MAG: transglutaminase domain-containing protein [Sandaracinaceae bacterium]